MQPAPLSFWSRLVMATLLPLEILANGTLAAQIAALQAGARLLTDDEAAPSEAEPSEPEPSAGEAALKVQPEPVEPEPVQPEAGAADPAPALQLLGLLQREGRLIDFLQQDITDVPDADIGAAARVVHEGCRRSLREVVELRPVRSEEDGTQIVLEEGFDPSRHRLTGQVSGAPPYRGELAHHGWEVARITLPALTEGHDPRVVAPAEVEL